MPWQPVTVAPADAELVMTTGIRALLVADDQDDVFVSNEIPNPRRPKMVVWNRDGGGADDALFDEPLMRCRVWAPTDKQANDLAADVIRFVQHMRDGNPITFARKQSGPYDVPDDSGVPQKYVLFEIRMRSAT